MKTSSTRITICIFTCLTAVGAIGCGEPIEDTQGGVVIVGTQDHTTPSVHNDPPNPTTVQVSTAVPVETTGVSPSTLTEFEPSITPSDSIHAVEIPNPPADSADTDGDTAVIERGYALMNQNLFLRSVSVASSHDHVFIAIADEDTISLAGYDDELRAQFIVELPKSFEGSSSCSDALKVLYKAGSVSVVERRCGDEVEVNVRTFSTMGEPFGQPSRFAIDEAGRVSVDVDFGGVVLLSVTEDSATWYEVSAQNGLKRTMTQVLESAEGDRRIQHIAHAGSMALLQYSDGLMRRISYAIRCGTTSEFNFRTESSNTARNQMFQWDEHSASYLRYAGLVDGEEQIESIHRLARADAEQLTMLTIERGDTVGEYENPTVLHSADGPRLLYNHYSSDQFRLFDPTGASEVTVEKRLHGDLSRAWSILGGTGSLLLFQGRCNDYLYTVRY